MIKDPIALAFKEENQESVTAPPPDKPIYMGITTILCVGEEGV